VHHVLIYKGKQRKIAFFAELQRCSQLANNQCCQNFKQTKCDVCTDVTR